MCGDYGLESEGEARHTKEPGGGESDHDLGNYDGQKDQAFCQALEFESIAGKGE
jgi:hypothetical protein